MIDYAGLYPIHGEHMHSNTSDPPLHFAARLTSIACVASSTVVDAAEGIHLLT